MPRREIAGGMIKGWTDRKRPEQLEFKDLQERTFFATTPITELEGRITPTEYYYVVNQLGAPELIHPDEWRLAISGVTDRSIKLELADLKKLPSRTVRAVTECAGNDMLFFDYLEKGGHKPSLLGPKRGGKGLEAIPVTGMVSAGEFTGVSLRDVLALAGVRPEAVAVRLQGADRGRPDPALVWGSAGNKSIEVQHLRGDQLRQGPSHREGHGHRHDPGVVDERRASQAHPWRAGARGRARLVGELVGQVADADRRHGPHARLLPDPGSRAAQAQR